jgi:hypothetical protein
MGVISPWASTVATWSLELTKRVESACGISWAVWSRRRTNSVTVSPWYSVAEPGVTWIETRTGTGGLGTGGGGEESSAVGAARSEHAEIVTSVATTNPLATQARV